MTELQQVINTKASVYALVNGDWKDRGHGGQFMLYYYQANPQDMLVRWWKHEKSLAYQLVPGKLKSKGDRSWALRAYNMDYHPPIEEIIAVRFCTDASCNTFREHFEKISAMVFSNKRSTKKRPSHHLSSQSMGYSHGNHHSHQNRQAQHGHHHSSYQIAHPTGNHYANNNMNPHKMMPKHQQVHAQSSMHLTEKVHRNQSVHRNEHAKSVYVSPPPNRKPPPVPDKSQNARLHTRSPPPPPRPPSKPMPSLPQQQMGAGAPSRPKPRKIEKEERQSENKTTWACPGCTFANQLDVWRCRMCNTARPSSQPQTDWNCPRCTVVNPARKSVCHLCRHPRPGMGPPKPFPMIPQSPPPAPNKSLPPVFDPKPLPSPKMGKPLPGLPNPGKQEAKPKVQIGGRSNKFTQLQAMLQSQNVAQKLKAQSNNQSEAEKMKREREKQQQIIEESRRRYEDERRRLEEERKKLEQERLRLEEEREKARQRAKEEERRALSPKLRSSPSMSGSDAGSSVVSVTRTWNCPICTLCNSAHSARCEACGTPNRVKAMMDHAESSSSYCGDYDYQNIEITMPTSPKVQGKHASSRHSKKSSIKSVRSLFEQVGNNQGASNQSSKFVNQYEMMREIGGAGLSSSKAGDFEKVVSDIATYNSNPRRVLSTLKSVAKKLLKDEVRYRTLDTTNPRVEERLIGFEGVLDFLYLLGFESDAVGQRLICRDKPPMERVFRAIDALDSFDNPMRMRKPTFDNGNRRQELLQQAKAEDDRKGDSIDVDAIPEVDEVAASEDDTMTLQQIVLWCTHEQMRDNDTMETLIMCHRDFSDSLTLLRELRKRFFVNPPHGMQEGSREMEEFTLKTMKPIQLAVVKNLRNWMKQYWAEDFAKKTDLLSELDNWLKKMQANAKKYKWNGLLAHTVRTELKRYKKSGGPLDRLPEKDYMSVKIPKSFSMSKMSPNDLADQITLMDYRIFRKIRPRECLGQAWKKKDNKDKSPNILRMIQQFNNLTTFVQIQILNEKSLRDRRKSIRHFIKMAERFRETRNYNSLCAIFSALNSAPIHRLKLAWEKLPPKHRDTLDQCKMIFARDYNHRNLRQLFRNAPAPSIPHIGIFLSDLVFIDDAHDNQKEVAGLGRKMVNFSKSVRCADRIKQIQMYQLHPYNEITEDDKVQRILIEEFAKNQNITEDVIWDKSTAVKKQDVRDKRTIF